MNKPHSSINVTIAGLTTAFFLLVGTWEPWRILPFLVNVDPASHIAILLQPRQWLFLVLLATLFGQVESENTTIPRFKRCERWNFVFFLLLCIYMAVSALWSPDILFGLFRSHEMIIMLVTLCCVRVWIKSNFVESYRKAFWTSLSILTLLLALAAFFTIGSSERLSTLGGGPNIFGRLMGLLAISAASWKKSFFPGQNVLVITIALALVVLTGSRGAMAAVVVALVVYLAYDKRSLFLKVMLICTGCLAFIFLIIYTGIGEVVANSFTHRVIYLVFEKGYDTNRENLLTEAIQLWLQSPIIGHGLGGFAAYGSVNYPHNIIAELLAEGGLIALTLFVLCMLPVFWVAITKRHQVDPASMAAFILYLVASMFSGYFYNTLGVYLFMMFVIVPCDMCKARISNR